MKWWIFAPAVVAMSAVLQTSPSKAADLDHLPEPPTPTKVFDVRGGSAYLGDKPVRLWGLRCVHALRDRSLTERLVKNLDNFNAHGLNLISVYMQAAHGGYPDIQAGANPFDENGILDLEFARRLEWLAREADERGMVLLIGVITPIKDQELKGDDAIRTAIEETGRFLVSRKINNVVVDCMYEFDHPNRIRHDALREPDGVTKKSLAVTWLHSVAPNLKAGVTTESHSKSPKAFAGMDLHLIQKGDPIPDYGYALNIESVRRDKFGTEGIFTPQQKESLLNEWERYRAAPNVGYVLNTAYTQAIGGADGEGPHFEMGGQGTGPNDRGIRFYYEWVRDNVGSWEYPHHVKKNEGPNVRPKKI